jgi:ATP-dependent Clp protease adaptor protein ClpS
MCVVSRLALAASRRLTHIGVRTSGPGPGRAEAAVRERLSGDTGIASASRADPPSGLSLCVSRVASRGDSLNAYAMSPLTLSSDPQQKPAIAFRAVSMSNDENRSPGNSGPSTSIITKVKPKTKRPNLYRVLILNDDYTPMEFVVHVLEKFFNKDVEAATKIMLHVHHHGIGECGVFTYEIAETKVTQVMDFARKHQHPLQCVMEKK